MRSTQAELGTRVDRRAGAAVEPAKTKPSTLDAVAFANGLGKQWQGGEQLAIHRRRYVRRKVRARRPSMLDPHLPLVEGWLAAEPHLTAIAILGRLGERYPGQFGKPQHSIVQRLLKASRAKAASQLIADTEPTMPAATDRSGDGSLAYVA
jgi:hypothetical protein